MIHFADKAGDSSLLAFEIVSGISAANRRLQEFRRVGRSSPISTARVIKRTSPISAARTVLLIGEEPARRRLFGDILRRDLACRVAEAPSVAEGRYLAAVEDNIRLLLLSDPAMRNDDLEFARWFHSTIPDGRVLIASDALWELNGEGREACRMLIAKSYAAGEMAAAVRRLLGET
jgi:hypothetical protein